MFSCEFYEISKNTFFTEHRWTTASLFAHLELSALQYSWNYKQLHLFNTLISSTRSNHRRCSMKIGVLENFTKFTGKQLHQSLYFKTPTQVFSFEFCEIFKNTFFVNTSGLLRLHLLREISSSLIQLVFCQCIAFKVLCLANK